MTLILLSLIGITACKSVEYVPIDIPTFAAMRPERPQLEGGDSIEAKNRDILALMIYGREWEAYGDGVEAFIRALKEMNR